jgi:hypothetical protein
MQPVSCNAVAKARAAHAPFRVKGATAKADLEVVAGDAKEPRGRRQSWQRELPQSDKLSHQRAGCQQAHRSSRLAASAPAQPPRRRRLWRRDPRRAVRRMRSSRPSANSRGRRTRNVAIGVVPLETARSRKRSPAGTTWSSPGGSCARELAPWVQKVGRSGHAKRDTRPAWTGSHCSPARTWP